MPASDKYWRPLKRMHVVFALSCAALLLVTLLMMGKDHGREWKDVQRTAEKIDTLRLQLDLYDKGALADEEVQQLANSLTEEQRADLAVFLTSSETSYQEAQKALDAAIKQAEEDLSAKDGELAPIRDDLADLELAFDLASRRDRGQKAVRDKARADYDLSVRDELPESVQNERLTNFKDQERLVEQNVAAVQRAKADVDAKRAELAEATRERDDLAAQLTALRGDEDRIRAARNKLEPETTVAWMKRKVMEWPIIDGFNGHLRIQQDWLPDLDITLGMSSTARFDRCRTCHLNADKVLAGGIPAYPHGDHVESEDYRDWVAENEFPHPFSTHPRTDLYTTATSPHPVTTFGCTICHQGNGSGTSFQNAEHGPDDPHQEHEWKEEYGYHSNHFWEYPMYSDRFVEATCIKCHHDVTELGVNPTFGPTAPKVVKGFETIANYGCFGCHEIHGFDGDDRIGPDLRTEPNYAAAAAQVLVDPIFANRAGFEARAAEGEADDEEAVDDEAEPEERPAGSLSPAGLARIRGELASHTESVTKSLADPTADPVAQRASVIKLLAFVAEVTPTVQHAIPAAAEKVVGDQDLDEPRRTLLTLLDTADKLSSADSTYRARLDRIPVGEETEASPDAPTHLDVRTRGLAAALEDQPHPGKFRKVGPALRHVAAKTDRGWLEFWTEKPSRFRPSTRMPQFWHLSNQEDELAEEMTPVEIASVVQYLLDKSQSIDLIDPPEGYAPKSSDGATAFASKGCLACHQHSAFPAGKADFGPNLSRVFAKINPQGLHDADGNLDPTSEGFRWLYTWILDPERHHPRTRMPNLYVNENATAESDPAADIAAFLLTNPTQVVVKAMPPKPDVDDVVELIESDYGEAVAVIGEAAFGINFNRLDETQLAKPIADVERLVETLPAVVKVFDSASDADEFAEELGDVDGVEVEVRRDRIGEEFNAAGDIPTDGFTDPAAVNKLENLEEPESFDELAPLDRLVAMNLVKSLTKDAALEVLKSRRYPTPADRIKGDEIELAGPAAESEEEWEQRMLNYIGRRTISRYGCYGCHDVPGFETARPIGTVLQDWGRKDTSKLATEHIHEYLKHHGDLEAAEKAVAQAAGGEFKTDEARSDALRPAYFFEDLLHHGRAGFLWQKLRAPRSYDYEKTATKGFDERLRMPLFPLDDDQREAVATFVLGLVAEPPPSEYVYQPDSVAKDRIEGEFLLKKYNCVGCHYVELPEFRLALDLEEGDYTGFDSLDTVAEEGEDFYPNALQALVDLKPVRRAWKGETKDGKAIVEFHGLLAASERDPEEPLTDVDFNFDVFQTWENLDVGPPGSPRFVTVDKERITVAPADVLSRTPARGGEFTEFLVNHLGEGDAAKTGLAWQSGPPPLIGEGAKVQTPWLYRFLRNPFRIRPMVVVRMPRFNMSPAEARTLANYFAAKDGNPYPYQALEETDDSYLGEAGSPFDLTGGEYLDDAWTQLHNAKVQCYKCHEFAANQFAGPITYMKDVRGPNLGRVNGRLRPEWMYVWLSKPRWLLPYTGMPVNYGRPKPNEEPKSDLFGGDPDAQVIAVRNALLNYPRALEEFGKIEPPPTAPADPAAPENAGAAPPDPTPPAKED